MDGRFGQLPQLGLLGRFFPAAAEHRPNQAADRLVGDQFGGHVDAPIGPPPPAAARRRSLVGNVIGGRTAPPRGRAADAVPIRRRVAPGARLRGARAETVVPPRHSSSGLRDAPPTIGSASSKPRSPKTTANAGIAAALRHPAIRPTLATRPPPRAHAIRRRGSIQETGRPASAATRPPQADAPADRRRTRSPVGGPIRVTAARSATTGRRRTIRSA